MNTTPFYSNNSYLQNQRSNPKPTARLMKSSMNLTNDFKDFKVIHIYDYSNHWSLTFKII